MAAAVRAIRARKRKERRSHERANKSPQEGNELAEDSKDTGVGHGVMSDSGRAAEERDFPVLPGFGRLSGHFGRMRPLQVQVFKLYNTPHVTWFIASIILANFFAIIVEKEFDPYTVQRFPHVWVAIDDVSNSIFVVELVMNYYGSGYIRFWKSGWNMFDSGVVLVGMLTLFRIPLGSFSQLKMLRTFRVFRLFKRIKSLNKIIVALLNAIPGVLNAFVIMLIFMAIYAILAVDYFRTFGGSYAPLPGGALPAGAEVCASGENKATSGGHGCASYTTIFAREFPEYINGTFGNATHTALSHRGYVIGDEYYGTFSRALFTLFQVLTGDSWAEVIVRPLLFGYNNAGAMSATFVGVFFSSYLLLMQIVLINVVVAVLLDKFVADDPEKSSSGGGEADAKKVPAQTPISPAARKRAMKKAQTAASLTVPPQASASPTVDACDAAMDQAQNGAASAAFSAGSAGVGGESFAVSVPPGGLAQLQGDVAALARKVDKLGTDMEQILSVLRKTYVEEPRPLPVPPSGGVSWWSGGRVGLDA